VFHPAPGDEPNQFKNELLRNEAQLYFLSIRSPLDCGARGGPVKGQDERPTTPLTAPPNAKGDLIVFSC
jgi:hypothetical protein